MWQDFKKFALKGNVIDLAVAVVIGGAFGKIITSFVNDIIMPLIGLLLGKVDFTNLFIVLGNGEYLTIEEAKAAGAVTLNYGVFFNNIVDFLIITFAIFMVIRQLNRFKKAEAPAPISAKTCPFCFSEIHIDASRCPHCTSDLTK